MLSEQSAVKRSIPGIQAMQDRDMNRQRTEWSRYYRRDELRGLEILLARFINHRCSRHVYDYCSFALVETAAASCWYRGAQRVAVAGHNFIINPGEPHTGGPVFAMGYCTAYILRQSTSPASQPISGLSEPCRSLKILPSMIGASRLCCPHFITA